MEQKLISPNAGYAKVIDVAGTDLMFRTVTVTDRTPTARQVLTAMNLSPPNEYVVLQWLPGGDIEEVRPDELVDMNDATTPKLIVAKADRTFRLVLNNHSLSWPEDDIEEETLRALGAVDANLQIYMARDGEPDRLIKSGKRVNLRPDGVETFYAKSSDWTLNVQGVVIKSETPEISARDAMNKAGFNVESAWIIILKTATQRKQVELDYVIDLREPGIEKLRLTPREINNGEVTTDICRDFAVLPADQIWLNNNGYEWVTVVENGRRWLILRNVALPAGFNVAAATIAMEVPTAYPMAEIDMFYCHPHLARADGQPIPQTQVHEIISGQSFQRWSRHRGSVAPWRPGKDSVITHLLLIDESLNREVEKCL